jgi:hypothetical protein
MSKFYVIIIQAGDITQSDMYSTFKDRDNEAKRIWTTLTPILGDNVYWADVASDGTLVVGPYLEGSL